MMLRREELGFTLIELIVVVAIAAILAAVAIPNYSAYVVRSNRAAAKAVLLEAAQWMERNYTANGCYGQSTLARCQTTPFPASDLPLPTSLQAAPKEGTAKYAVSLDTTAFAGGQAFRLIATPVTADPECGNLTLTNTGVRGISTSVVPAVVAQCWQR